MTTIQRYKMKQGDIIYRFVKLSGGLGVSTADVIKYGLSCRIGCPDRRLRELQETNIVIGKKEKKSRCKRWYAVGSSKLPF